MRKRWQIPGHKPMDRPQRRKSWGQTAGVEQRLPPFGIGSKGRAEFGQASGDSGKGSSHTGETQEKQVGHKLLAHPPPSLSMESNPCGPKKKTAILKFGRDTPKKWSIKIVQIREREREGRKWPEKKAGGWQAASVGFDASRPY